MGKSTRAALEEEGMLGEGGGHSTRCIVGSIYNTELNMTYIMSVKTRQLYSRLP